MLSPSFVVSFVLFVVVDDEHVFAEQDGAGHGRGGRVRDPGVYVRRAGGGPLRLDNGEIHEEARGALPDPRGLGAA